MHFGADVFFVSFDESDVDAQHKIVGINGGAMTGAQEGATPTHHSAGQTTGALWSGTNKNTDVSTGSLARPFARSLAPLTHSLAPDCSLRSRPPLRSLIRSLAHFAHSLARGTVI